MKNALLLACYVGALPALSLCHAAPFQNLSFDNANTNNLQYDPFSYGGIGLPSELLPGWQVYFGASPATYTGFDFELDSARYNTLFSSSFPGRIPLVGLYSLAVITGPVPDGLFVPFSLSQVGDLPADVKSIHFLSYGSPFQLEVNGSLVSLAYTPAVRQPDWNPLAPVFDAVGDISPFAGETVELRFTTLQGADDYNGLDAIYFSTIGIPEPSSLLLFSVGGVALLVARFRASRSACRGLQRRLR